MSQESRHATTGESTENQLRRGSLGVLGIAFFVVSAAAPLTAMAGGAPTAMAFSNGSGIPFAYVLISLLLLTFSVGYTAMARFHTSAGAFYSYIARGLRQYAGGAGALIALLGYNAMQIGLYGLFGAATAGFFSQYNVNFPWWVWSFAAMALIAVLGYRQVDLSLKVIGILVAAEFLVVLAFDVAVLVKGGQGGGAALTFEPFTFGALTSGSVALALLFNAAAFIGFEATTIYSEEAKDPARTVPRATYAAVLTIGLFYTFTTWLMVNSFGPAGLVDHLLGLKPDPTAFLFEQSTVYLGGTFTTVMSLLFATSVFAALMAFHNAVARYLYALGREGILPAQLGHTHRIHLSPHKGSVSQSLLAFVVVLAFVLTNKDPVNQLFVWLTQLGTLAIMVLMALASAAVIAFFLRHPNLDRSVWRTKVAPMIATLGTLWVAVYASSQFGLLINNPGSSLRWILPGLIPVFAAVGVALAARLRATNPQLYAEMGRHRG